MNIQEVFDKFCASIANRKRIMTEDNIRYYWFDAMRTVEGENFDLNHYTMEYPYDSKAFIKGSIGKKELDLLYDNEKECICMEIKFHRNPSGTTFACPDAAGSLFNDLIRLSIFEPGKAHKNSKENLEISKNRRYLFLYVTDYEMNNYLGSDGSTQAIYRDYRNELQRFYTMSEMQTISPLFKDVTCPETFENCALKSFVDADKNVYKLTCKSIHSITLLRKKDDVVITDNPTFPSNTCYIRLYEVKKL